MGQLGSPFRCRPARILCWFCPPCVPGDGQGPPWEHNTPRRQPSLFVQQAPKPAGSSNLERCRLRASASLFAALHLTEIGVLADRRRPPKATSVEPLGELRLQAECSPAMATAKTYVSCSCCRRR